MKTLPKHPKLRGEWAECHFLARASEHGLRVSKPYGDCLPYDFIVEHGGRMLRVQVKSTSFQCPGYIGYKCFVKPSPKGARYAKGMIDFIAACILPKPAESPAPADLARDVAQEIWYIIPFAEVAGTATVHLDPDNPRNRYRAYREAWDLLLNAPERTPKTNLKQMSS